MLDACPVRGACREQGQLWVRNSAQQLHLSCPEMGQGQNEKVLSRLRVLQGHKPDLLPAQPPTCSLWGPNTEPWNLWTRRHIRGYTKLGAKPGQVDALRSRLRDAVCTVTPRAEEQRCWLGASLPTVSWPWLLPMCTSETFQKSAPPQGQDGQKKDSRPHHRPATPWNPLTSLDSRH